MSQCFKTTHLLGGCRYQPRRGRELGGWRVGRCGWVGGREVGVGVGRLLSSIL